MFNCPICHDLAIYDPTNQIRCVCGFLQILCVPESEIMTFTFEFSKGQYASIYYLIYEDEIQFSLSSNIIGFGRFRNISDVFETYEEILNLATVENVLIT
jgi:hypothetical protein